MNLVGGEKDPAAACWLADTDCRSALSQICVANLMHRARSRA